MKKNSNARTFLLLSLIAFAAISRIIPHLPNFSPLGAIALFGAAHFSRKWQAFIVPLAATWLSDLFLNNAVYNNHGTFQWFSGSFYWMYGSYLLITLAGIFLLKKVTLSRIVAGTMLSAGIFFLVTNFGCWLGSKQFPQNFSGLMECYAVAIPFLKGTLLGDATYVTLLFGTFAWVEKRFPELKEA